MSALTLSPPLASRARSSSTDCRPPEALRLCTFGRRTAADKTQQLSLEPQKVCSSSSSQKQEPQSMSLKVARWFQAPKPSTPDEFVLPVSTPTQSSFPDISLPEKSPKSSSHLPLIIVLLLFPLSTFVVLLALYTLPISVSWPRTVSDLVQLVTELHGYSQSGMRPIFHIIAVMSISAVWKHAWSIPGSVVWNVLAGALFSPALATVLLTILTTLGSASATLLAMPLAPYIQHFFPRALDMTRSALQPPSSSASKSPAWVRLSILRLIGVIPWSGINIACGVCAVPLVDCMLGTFIGTLPWTAVTCQIGDILQTVASHPSPTPQTVSSLLTSPTIIAKLAVLSFLSLAPILARDRLKELIAGSSSSGDASVLVPGEDRKGRNWVQGWKDKIRRASRSRSPLNKQESELDMLVREKEEMRQDLSS